MCTEVVSAARRRAWSARGRGRRLPSSPSLQACRLWPLFSTQDVSGNRDPARPEQPVGSMCDRQLPPSGPPTRQGYAGVASADWRKGATSRETTAGFGPKIAPRFASERRNAREFQNRPFLALGPAYRRPHAQGYFVAGWRPPVAARSSRCDDLLGGGGANAASRKPLPHG